MSIHSHEELFTDILTKGDNVVAVCNAIIVQLSRIMSILLTGNVWIVSTRVICGDDYAIISWREVMVERSAVRRQEINK